MNTQTIPNPWDSASDPQSAFDNKGFWGQCRVDAFNCALVKGVGKGAYDPNSHGDRKPLTAVKVDIVPLPEQQITNPNVTARDYVAEFKEWRDITWPSLKALQVKNLAEIKERWVWVTTKETGDTYEKTDDEGNTTTRNKTTFVFQKLFANEAECRADYLAQNGGGNTEQPPWQTPQQAQPGGNGSDREVALKFARVIVNNAAKGQSDLNTVLETVRLNIAQTPVVSAHVSADDDEVQTMILEAMAA